MWALLAPTKWEVGVSGTTVGGVWGPGWAGERGQKKPHQVQQVPSLVPVEEQAQAPAQSGVTLLESSLAEEVLVGPSTRCLLGRGLGPLAKGGSSMY